ncbi:unnamed protein product (macronuclear) [Paramecium tetraurelia]|uniref:Steroid dehydrogenase n=1 Tax=Paramecium tetraurelia TaxID=5888 RepID=A0E302_PARTE|nr:uncharacterized protein GSPATT00022842001 [Paramecium tetraurelia]CAK89669.1 unnamed protein product [Paramecium tetraurelia]|eukprot:XP_001457066.1 hypothetical protein (macronuclear) [Paramecium tetraurelia strain d4-2]
MELLRRGFQSLVQIHSKLIHKYYQHLYRKRKLRTFLMGVGSLYLLRRLSQLAMTLTPSLRRNLLGIYGEESWAIVTGVSDGIGKEFCIQLAKQKFNIAIIGRNAKQMDQLCLQLQGFGVQTKFIVADFNQGYEVDFYNKIYEQLHYLDISILVNNARVLETGQFEQTKMEDSFSMLRVNALSTLMMTKILINKLQNRIKKAAVITISSGLAYLPSPLVSVYSGTSAFTNYFTQSLSFTSQKIDFLSATPLSVKSKMDNTKDPDIIETSEFVRNVINDLREGKTHSFGSCRHRRQINFLLWRKQSVRNKARILLGNSIRGAQLETGRQEEVQQ